MSIDGKYCSFCLRNSSEVKLIDTRTNLIQIEHECFDFSTIFKDILHFDPSNEFTCEVCKDQFVQFFIFKNSIKLPQNPVKFIVSQIDDFLKDVSVNEIKVIRTINSITLQSDDTKKPEQLVPKEEMETENNFVLVTEEENPTYEVLNEAVTCKECGNVETSDIDLEIHEFFKHTSFGIHLETELDNCRVIVNHLDDNKSSLYVCSVCNAQTENSDILLLHLLEDHCEDIISHINNYLFKTNLNMEVVTRYLNHIRDCLNGTNQEFAADFDDRNYFYQAYNIHDDDDNEELITDNAFDQSGVQEHSDIDMLESHDEKLEKRTEKLNELSNEDKEWIRAEINRGKVRVGIEKGGKGYIYRCTISKGCTYASNSSPGLRYHLIVKHLKDRNNLTEQRRSEEKFSEIFPVSHVPYKNSSKNSCLQCCLKFKDGRSLQIHDKSHELFQVVAEHSSFPICNTCNIKFLDTDTLNIHLNKHELKEDIREIISVPDGAIREQGKPMKCSQATSLAGETSETEFTWKCGHCDKHFTAEEYCNYHILLYHVSIFTCPIDRMEFSGFKSVSLFTHHLRNKHPELFPNLSFKCTFCQMEFPSIYDKLQHMKNCDSKQFMCDHCEKRFFKKTDLALHLKLVTGELQYECSICYKKCLSRSDLKIHLRSHSKVKPYQCSLCNKAFRTLAARANHVESHNENQNYQCEACDKTFKQRQMYRRHMKMIHERTMKA